MSFNLVVKLRRRHCLYWCLEITIHVTSRAWPKTIWAELELEELCVLSHVGEVHDWAQAYFWPYCWWCLHYYRSYPFFGLIASSNFEILCSPVVLPATLAVSCMLFLFASRSVAWRRLSRIWQCPGEDEHVQNEALCHDESWYQLKHGLQVWVISVRQAPP